MAGHPPGKKSRSLYWILGVVGLLLGCVCCIGGGAAFGIPQMVEYQQRAKTAEAESQLTNMFQLAAGYYANEMWASRDVVARGATAHTACTVESARTSNEPGPDKTVIDWQNEPASFEAIGFAIADPVYYQYEIVSGGSACGNAPNSDLYTFRAYGDLDGDGIRSVFTITARSNANNELERSEIVRELELE